MADALEAIAAVEAERALGSSADSGYLGVLDATLTALERSGLPFLFMGGLASTVLGRPRMTEDIDVFVRPDDARTLLSTLGESGFRTEEVSPHWLFKAYLDGHLVDVIFRSTGGIYLDEEMLRRSVVREFRGRRLAVVGPEDMVVIKALAHQEVTPRHWFDALGILGVQQLDWEYLVARARRGPRRVLSLLLYAQASDLPVPWAVVRRLFHTLEEGSE